MLCYKNGSLARVPVCKETAGGDWARFDELIRKDSQPGNGGNIGFYFPQPPIIPMTDRKGIWRFGGDGEKVDGPFAEPAVEARAVVESQVLSMRLHSERIGLREAVAITVSGGASESDAIL